MSKFVVRRRARAALCLLIYTVLCTSLNAQVDFNRQVRPILSEHCFQCHGPDASRRSADLRLDLEVEAKKSAIVAGAAAESELIKRIQTTDSESMMPPLSTGKTLTAAQKDVLQQWIQEGAKYSNHWSFEPITASQRLLDALPSSEMGASPIDRFLLDRLSQAGLSYSRPVSRVQFIRRATFDLTGLPPTWAEIGRAHV